MHQILTSPFFLVLYIFIIGLGVSAIFAWSSLAPWLPTQRKDLKRINKDANLKPGQKFIEIGCGDARVCSYIARHNPKAHVEGIELAPPLYFYSYIKQKISGPKNLKIIYGNALKHDFSNYDVIYIYGLKETINNQIKKKLLKDMKKGSKFLSYVFSLDDDWKDVQTEKPGAKERSVHIYVQK